MFALFKVEKLLSPVATPHSKVSCQEILQQYVTQKYVPIRIHIQFSFLNTACSLLILFFIIQQYLQAKGMHTLSLPAILNKRMQQLGGSNQLLCYFCECTNERHVWCRVHVC